MSLLCALVLNWMYVIQVLNAFVHVLSFCQLRRQTWNKCLSCIVFCGANLMGAKSRVQIWRRSDASVMDVRCISDGGQVQVQYTSDANVMDVRCISVMDIRYKWDGCQSSDASMMDVKPKSDGCQVQVGRMSDVNLMNVWCKFDGCHMQSWVDVRSSLMAAKCWFNGCTELTFCAVLSLWVLYILFAQGYVSASWWIVFVLTLAIYSFAVCVCERERERESERETDCII